jgi:peptidoglycan-associated lipoprotein
MRLNLLSTLLLTAVLAAGAVGCKKKMDRVTPLPGYGGSGKIGDAPPDRLTPGNTPGDGGGLVAGNPNGIPQTGNRSIEGRPQDREKYRNETVYFEFDRSNVRASEASKVQEVANRFKNEDGATDLLIEGHCDERGTEEYNRSLGERRALALRELLVAAGISPDRVHTISYGKDRPIEPLHSDAAYSKNRRGEFILVLPK